MSSVTQVPVKPKIRCVEPKGNIFLSRRVMATNAPSLHFRKGISLVQLFRMFPDDETAEKWFIHTRWPDGIACVRCGSVNVNEKTAHATMPHRCRDSDKRFSVKLGTIMESSNLGYQIWIIALYLFTTSLKGFPLSKSTAI